MRPERFTFSEKVESNRGIFHWCPSENTNLISFGIRRPLCRLINLFTRPRRTPTHTHTEKHIIKYHLFDRTYNSHSSYIHHSMEKLQNVITFEWESPSAFRNKQKKLRLTQTSAHRHRDNSSITTQGHRTLSEKVKRQAKSQLNVQHSNSIQRKNY